MPLFRILRRFTGLSPPLCGLTFLGRRSANLEEIGINLSMSYILKLFVMKKGSLQGKIFIEKRKFHVKNPLNYDFTKSPGEKPWGVSQTVPDLSLSIREIYNRFTRGASLPYRESIDDEDPEMELPDPGRLDLVERQEYKEQYEQEIKDIRSPKKSKNDKEAENVSGEQQSENEAIPGMEDKTDTI